MTNETLRPLLCIVIVLQCGSYALALDSPRVLAEVQHAGILDRRILTSEAHFTKETVNTLAREFVSRVTGKFRLARLLIAVSQEELSRAVAHPSGYDGARQNIENYGYPHLPIAEILFIEGSAIVHYWFGGTEDEWNASGDRDPTVFQIGTDTFKLLHFQVQILPETFTKTQGLSQHVVHFYFQCRNKPSVEKTRLLTRRMIALSGFKAVDVRVRDDSWFLGYEDFPDVYRFKNRYDLPSREQFESGNWVACSSTFGKVSCAAKQ